MPKTIPLTHTPTEAYLVHNGRLHCVDATDPAAATATVVTDAAAVPVLLAKAALDQALAALPRLHPAEGDTTAGSGVVTEAMSWHGRDADGRWGHWALLDTGHAALRVPADIGHSETSTQKVWVLDHEYAAPAVTAFCDAVEVEDVVEALLWVAAPGPHPAVAE